MSNSIRRVTLAIETANGDFHKMVVDSPSPAGGNPRFMAQQLQSAIDELQRRADDLLFTYADQIAAS